MYLVVLDLAAIVESDRLAGRVDVGHRGVVLLLLCGQQGGHFLPDGARAALLGEAEHGVGAPVVLSLVSVL